MRWFDLLGVALGGGLGSVLRWVVVAWTAQRFGHQFPWGTLAVNLAGSFAIGVIAGWTSAGAFGLGPEARRFVVVGVLGGFTTFSSFSLDALVLGQRSPSAALLYIALSVGFGLAGAWLGTLVARISVPA